MTEWFYHVTCFAKVSLLLFSFWNMIFLLYKSCNIKVDTFYRKEVIAHIKWDVIISSSLRLLLKVWIWYRCQNRIENYYQHDGEQLGFYKKVHIKTQSKKKDVLVIFILLQETKNSNLFYKNYTQENVKCHIQHKENWPRWIVIELVNYK